MTLTDRAKRKADDKARKAEKARQRAAEAARRAQEAEQEAAEALAELATDDEPDVPDATAEPEATGTKTKAEPDADDEPDAEAEADDASEDDGDASGEAEDDDEPRDDEPEPVDLTKPSDAEAETKTDAPSDTPSDTVPGKPAGNAAGKAAATGGKAGLLGRLRPLVYALLVVNVVLAVLLVWAVVAGNAQDSERAAIEEVSRSATAAAEDLSSYDYRTIDTDLQRAVEHTTGNFRDQFQKQITQVKPSAKQQKAVVEGSAVRTAVESVDGDKAIALVYLNQQTAKEAQGQRTPNSYTLRMVMKKVGDRWLVSELQMI